jgi:nitrite reductase/ring-hydroxylating ferredoxin subunit
VIDESEGPVEVPAFAEEDIPLGQIRHIKIGKRDVAIAHTDTGFHALSNLCRHAFGPLGEGFMEGDIAICPWHGWRYDVTNGTTDHPNADVKTYETVVRDGWVFVRV